MKPDWKDAPDWSNYMWIGITGVWCVGYKKPKWCILTGGYVPSSNSRWTTLCDANIPEWSRSVIKNSLAKRT